MIRYMVKDDYFYSQYMNIISQNLFALNRHIIRRYCLKLNLSYMNLMETTMTCVRID